MSTQKPFYEKFIKNTTRGNEKANPHRKPSSNQHGEKKTDTHLYTHERYRSGKGLSTNSFDQQKPTAGKPYSFGTPVFAALTAEARRILEQFPLILNTVLPLDKKKKQALPQHIHSLFHELTDERSSRKTHYLNDPIKLSAYTHYYLWWNLVRLTKLLQTLDIQLDDGDYAADFGSGPLTFICALWIAKPQLRTKRLTWYCIDLSNKALSFGEDLFLALCAYTGHTGCEEAVPWTIKKIHGAFGVTISQKVSLVTEANMFNELFWDSPLSFENHAEHVHRTILHYLQPRGAVLCIEPGIPLAGEFLSLVRAEFLKTGFKLSAPCPHNGLCCFPHRYMRTESVKVPLAIHKWCHFTFETCDSPKNLLRLSQSAQLGKERASLSFLYGTVCGDEKPVRGTTAQGTPTRICSDIIKINEKTIGRYACSEHGFILITGPAHRKSPLHTAVSGTLLILPNGSIKLRIRDKKTHALLVRIDEPPR